MGDLKEQQPSMTIKDQINNLQEIGLIINDEEYAAICAVRRSLLRFTAAARRWQTAGQFKTLLCQLPQCNVLLLV